MHYQLETFLTFVYFMGMNGQIILKSNIIWLKQVQTKCDLTTQPQCSSDCSSILVCLAGNENPAMSIKCHSDTPYCERGVCTSTPGSCTSHKNTSNFICTASGVFPEPTDCTRYHVCSKSGSFSTQYECPTGSIYNSRLKLCQKGVPRFGHSSRKMCEKINCDKVDNEFITFPANQAFYAFCSVSNCGVRQIFMYKCDNEIDHIFDKKTRTCVFNCKSAGYFPDSLDCSVYYICNGHGNFIPRRVRCPPGYYFNGTACINSIGHCPLGSIVTNTMPPSVQITNQVQSSTQVTTTELSTENSSNDVTSQIYETSTMPSTDVSTQSPQYIIETLPTSHVSYPSILFLPCPWWLQNAKIC